MTAIDRMSNHWWDEFGDDCSSGVAGSATHQLRHIIEEEREIERLIAGHRVLDGIAELRFLVVPE